MNNPFGINYLDQVDNDLIKLAIEGDKKALESLILRHQTFVYNLALKLLHQSDDADDLTQEVFIKAITALSKFEGKSSFRTWLYRITVNHFLNSRKRKSELRVVDFESYFNSIERMPDYELNGAEENELKESVDELRIRCTAGMLMCLDREQRLIYILGEMFRIDHNLGSEIMGIAPGNFRIRLMRARDDLYSWMNKRCGLINLANPCRCSKKTKGYIEAGFVDPQNLQFNTRYKQKMYEVSQQEATAIEDTIEDLHARIFLEHPFQLAQTKILDGILNNELLRSILGMT